MADLRLKVENEELLIASGVLSRKNVKPKTQQLV
jgi:hypothetical protein